MAASLPEALGRAGALPLHLLKHTSLSVCIRIQGAAPTPACDFKKHSDDRGRQRARAGSTISSFPPVLSTYALRDHESGALGAANGRVPPPRSFACPYVSFGCSHFGCSRASRAALTHVGCRCRARAARGSVRRRPSDEDGAAALQREVGGGKGGRGAEAGGSKATRTSRRHASLGCGYSRWD